MRQVLARIKSDFKDLGNREGRRRLLTEMKRLSTEHSEPWRLGAATAVGLTIGLTPLYGLHLLICILFAAILRLNKVVVYAAANVSLPVMIPFIAVACIQAAYYAVHGRLLDLSHATVDELRYTFPLYWFGGALLLGGAIGTPLAILVATAAEHRRRRARKALEPIDPSAPPVTKLYRAFLPDGRFGAEVLKGKVKHDVVYDAVLSELGRVRSILDVGGGQGALPILLGLKSADLKHAVVLDWDRSKLARGAAAARRLRVPVAFRESDAFSPATSWPSGSFDAISCIDLLHYATVERQRSLVERMVKALAPGGRLIIRDMDKDLGWRTFMTLAQERFSLTVRLTRAGKLVPRSGRDLKRQLEGLGLSVEARRCHGATPFSNTLWIAVKPDAMLR